jgi:hypothetical protein
MENVGDEYRRHGEGKGQAGPVVAGTPTPNVEAMQSNAKEII